MSTNQTYHYADHELIHIGYRPPMLSNELNPRGRIELAVELQMSVVEPQSFEFESMQDAEEMRCAADESGVRIPSMGSELLPTGSPLPDKLNNAIDAVVELARILGCGYIFSRVSPPGEGVAQQEAWNNLQRNARFVSDKLAEHGIVLAVEADPPCFIHTLERFERAIALIDHPNCRPNFDPTNLYVCGSDPLDALASLGSAVTSGHIKDGFYRSPKENGEVPIGTGEIDYRAIFTELINAGRQVNLFLEHCASADEVRDGAAHISSVMKGFA